MSELLFDLEADPAEQSNIVTTEPEVARELRAELERWLAEMESVRGGIQLDQDAVL